MCQNVSHNWHIMSKYLLIGSRVTWVSIGRLCVTDNPLRSGPNAWLFEGWLIGAKGKSISGFGIVIFRSRLVKLNLESAKFLVRMKKILISILTHCSTSSRAVSSTCTSYYSIPLESTSNQWRREGTCGFHTAILAYPYKNVVINFSHGIKNQCYCYILVRFCNK